MSSLKIHKFFETLSLSVLTKTFKCNNETRYDFGSSEIADSDFISFEFCAEMCSLMSKCKLFIPNSEGDFGIIMAVLITLLIIQHTLAMPTKFAADSQIAKIRQNSLQD